MNNLKKYIDFNNYEKERTDYSILKNCSQRFINFLKKENIYEKFVDYLLKVDNDWKKDVWKTDIFCNVNEVDYIMISFNWSKTNEGDNFWMSINDKWLLLFHK
jgi:hypothetical protein